MVCILFLIMLSSVSGMRLQHTELNDLKCNPLNVTNGCGALGGVDGSTSGALISRAVFATRESVDAFLFAMDIDGNHNFSCQALCLATMAYSSSILGMKAPKNGGFACLDKACEEEIQVDGMLLRDSNNISIYNASDGVDVFDVKPHIPQMQNEKKEEKVLISYSKQELAHTIAGLFDVYFAPTFDSSPTAASLLEAELPPRLGPKMLNWKGEAGTNLISLAVLEADVWISAALRRMNDAGEELKHWFGRNDEQAAQRVRSMLFHMLHAVNNLYIKKADNSAFCGTEMMAYVASGFVHCRGHCEDIVQAGETVSVPGGGIKYVVHICENWWRVLGRKDPAWFYGTIIHESAHHFGVIDVIVGSGIGKMLAYGPFNTVKLAETDSMGALNNADNYMRFVYALAKKSSPLETIDKESMPVRTCKNKTNHVFTAEEMCSRIGMYGPCDSQTVLVSTRIRSTILTPACYPFCLQVQRLREQRLKDNGDVDTVCEGLNELAEEEGVQEWQQFTEPSQKSPTIDLPELGVPTCKREGGKELGGKEMCKELDRWHYKKDPCGVLLSKQGKKWTGQCAELCTYVHDLTKNKVTCRRMEENLVNVVLNQKRK